MIEKGGFGEVLLMGSNYWRSLQKPSISTWELHNHLNSKVPLKVGTNIDALLRGQERKITLIVYVNVIYIFHVTF